MVKNLTVDLLTIEMEIIGSTRTDLLEVITNPFEGLKETIETSTGEIITQGGQDQAIEVNKMDDVREWVILNPGKKFKREESSTRHKVVNLR